MVLILKRTNFLRNGIFGELRDTANNLICVTLEHSYQQSDGSFAPKIPKGEYTCGRGEHCLSGGTEFTTFEIKNVPGHTGILFHCGNFNSDSEGCVLVGRTKKADNSMITDSRLAFLDLMTLTDGDDSFDLVVK